MNPQDARCNGDGDADDDADADADGDDAVIFVCFLVGLAV